jgi:hypothetical protein
MIIHCPHCQAALQIPSPDSRVAPVLPFHTFFDRTRGEPQKRRCPMSGCPPFKP